jgi:predicted Rossmann fold nucleotide-binding protein DprA/Smf involved in DNA uptake
MSRQSDSVLFNSGTIEISGFINGIDEAAHENAPTTSF